jgi:hypothetical protein
MLVCPATNTVIFRVRLSRQCKAQSAVNGKPLTRIATPQCRLRRAPAGRAGKRSSAVLWLLAREQPLPASHALRLSTFRLAENYSSSGGAHYMVAIERVQTIGAQWRFAVIHATIHCLCTDQGLVSGTNRASTAGAGTQMICPARHPEASTTITPLLR